MGQAGEQGQTRVQQARSAGTAAVSEARESSGSERTSLKKRATSGEPASECSSAPFSPAVLESIIATKAEAEEQGVVDGIV